MTTPYVFKFLIYYGAWAGAIFMLLLFSLLIYLKVNIEFIVLVGISFLAMCYRVYQVEKQKKNLIWNEYTLAKLMDIQIEYEEGDEQYGNGKDTRKSNIYDTESSISDDGKTNAGFNEGVEQRVLTSDKESESADISFSDAISESDFIEPESKKHLQ